MLTKPSQIRETTREEVKQRLESVRQELFSLRLQKGIKQGLANPLRLRTARREIARMEAILREDERGKHRLATTEK